MGNFRTPQVRATLKETSQRMDRRTGKPIGPEEIVQPEHPVATRPITREEFWRGSKVRPPDLPDDSAPNRQMFTSREVFIERPKRPRPESPASAAPDGTIIKDGGGFRKRPTFRERSFRGVKRIPPIQTQVRPLEEIRRPGSGSTDDESYR